MSDVLVATRVALHAVAEHVVAAALHSWNGRIGLRATPGGFGTPVVDGRQVRIDGLDLVVVGAAGERRAPLTTLAAAADHVGVALGAPEGVYAVVTSAAAPDARLTLDAGAATTIADWFALVAAALRTVAPEAPAQLWPEHFDLATTVAEVNLGGSPGDDQHDEPYLYVGPWALPPPPGDPWNEPWGASWPASSVPDTATAVRLLEQGGAAART